MALKPITEVKENFVSNVGKKVIPSPRSRRIKNLEEETDTAFKLLTFGSTGSGKTYILVGLLLHGFKVFVVSTDIGGDGLNTVKMGLKNLGRPELIKNCYFDVLDDAEEITKFLKDPQSVYDNIYDLGIDWLFWDGFSSYQQNLLPVIIGNMMESKAASSEKEIPEVREEGYLFETQDWGVFRNMTVRSLDKFLKINNKKDGKVWHKVITCLEGIKPVSTGTNTGLATTVYRETREPFLQGSALKLVGPAFDLILNTRVELEGKERAYKYICAGHDSPAGAKTRGLNLPPVMEGDMYKLWQNISSQLDISVKTPAVTEATNV